MPWTPLDSRTPVKARLDPVIFMRFFPSPDPEGLFAKMQPKVRFAWSGALVIFQAH